MRTMLPRNGMKSAMTPSGAISSAKPITSSTSPTSRSIQVMSVFALTASANIFSAGTVPVSTISSWSPAIVW